MPSDQPVDWFPETQGPPTVNREHRPSKGRGPRPGPARWRRLLPVLLVCALAAGCERQAPQADLERPTAAVYSAGADRIFVLDHAAGGAGASIARLTRDGRVEQRRWLTGFSSQAVLMTQGAVLYVADGAAMRRFDVHSGAELGRVEFDRARLSDLAVDAGGLVHGLDRDQQRVLRLVDNRMSHLLLPHDTKPIAILHAADALWILLAAGDGRGGAVLLRRSRDDEERVCRLESVSAQSVLLSLDRQRIGLFDSGRQRLYRFDRDCRPLLHWRIAAGPVRFALLPDDRLAIPEPEARRVRVMPAPDRLLADAPKAFTSN